MVREKHSHSDPLGLPRLIDTEIRYFGHTIIPYFPFFFRRQSIFEIVYRFLSLEPCSLCDG